MVLINRIRTQQPHRETPCALGWKPTLGRKPGENALSSWLFQGLLGTLLRTKAGDSFHARWQRRNPRPSKTQIQERRSRRERRREGRRWGKSVVL
jgi:hypothetical protein